jgi:hypothetical protein
MSKRVFAFGCSFTEFQWPTWADVIGNSLHQQGYEYYNFGNSGSGNYYILSSLFWADKKYKFTDDDIIIIMWSSWGREDRYMMEYHWTPGLRGQWTKEGNILSAVGNSRNFTEEFTRYWSLENDIIKNISSIEIARKLYNIDFESNIRAYEPEKVYERKWITEDIGEKIFEKFITMDPEQSTDTSPWQTVFNKYNGKSDEHVEPYVATIQNNDGHPPPMAHMDYVKLATPTIRGLETVTEKTEKYIIAFTDRMKILLRERWENASPKIVQKHSLEQQDYTTGTYKDLWYNEWPLDLLSDFSPETK